MLILGSQSKVRYQLLRLYNAEIKVMVANIDETFNENLGIKENVKLIAKRKADNILESIKLDDDILVCADTVVIVNGKYFTKPNDFDEAYAMVKSFSCNQVQVVTGVYLQYLDVVENFFEVSTITFPELTKETILNYLNDNDNCLEIAGALAIEKIGAYVDFNIEGSVSNVMGLPMETISQLLSDNNSDNVLYTTNKIDPINIYRSSVRCVIIENDQVILLNGYTFDLKDTFLMTIGGGYHCFEDKPTIMKKEAIEEGGLLLDNLRYLGQMKEYTKQQRYINYNKLTLHTYYLADVVDYTCSHYVEYEKKLLIGLERFSLNEAISRLEKQVAYYKAKSSQIEQMTSCDLQALMIVRDQYLLKSEKRP